MKPGPVNNVGGEKTGMAMETLTFKSNIDSSESVSRIRQLLDDDDKIQYWHVDILKEDHLLTVTGNNLDYQEIKDRIKQAGFKLERAEG
jgi:hypothetical protein